ncbi:PTS-dependent dihydroxyacetone kinase phosphotransferase subunit DhaM [Actinotalea sp. BY-33]|uniref:Phosphocarrier protein HPr n=1 Tax=Actinotalea soli TaxID=2819234 RepID=A0A939LRY6_9CELL|nr:dihydroxyacetone kinase phosphoryl donor subunit DhaM [Actinotalea soli]MBO1751575.1 PTS-dependent dihydroxyacetone kinase phosphotransferase subunit DhaM [Actinotalea soli]
MRPALVLVSHSQAAAEGVAEIARQMAPDVTVLPAGGFEGGVGTSPDRVLEAVSSATEAGAGVVLLTDLGSAVLTAEMVLEMLDEEVAARVRVPTAPFVEGAVAAAVEAQQGGDLDAVERAAVEAGRLFAPAPAQDPASQDDRVPAPGEAGTRADSTGESAHATVTLRNPLGLHARPAALLARAVAELGVPVTVDGVNAASVLELMRLGATGGQELTVVAHGPGAQAAVRAVVAQVAEGFGEA